MKENDKSLTIVNSSLSKIEKQIAIGNKILQGRKINKFIIVLNDDKNIFKFSIENYIANQGDILNRIYSTYGLIKKILTVDEKSDLFFFTKTAKSYQYPLSKIKNCDNDFIPQFINIFEKEDVIKSLICVKKNEDFKNLHLIIISKKGYLKKIGLENFYEKYSHISGYNLIKFKNSDDELFDVRISSAEKNIILASKFGRIIHKMTSNISIKKNPTGIKTFIFEDDLDQIIGLEILDKNDKQILMITEKGFFSKNKIDDYRTVDFKFKGVKGVTINKEITGYLKSLSIVNEYSMVVVATSSLLVFLKEENIILENRTCYSFKIENKENLNMISNVISWVI